MTTISEVFNKPLPAQRLKMKPSSTFLLPDVCMGIEVEIERSGIDTDTHQTDSGLLNVVHDGSLRNGGAEFILSEPLFGEDLKDAIMAIEEEINSLDNPDFGFRTSTHVHLDVRELETRDILKTILVYSLLEDNFFNLSNKERYYSPFCIPLRYALKERRYAMEIVSLWDHWDTLSSEIVSSDRSRYYALNLASLYRFGSLEFRMFNSTGLAQDLIRWVNMVQFIRYGIKYVTDAYSVDITALVADYQDKLGSQPSVNTSTHHRLQKLIRQEGSFTHTEYPQGSFFNESTSEGESGVDWEIAIS